MPRKDTKHIVNALMDDFNTISVYFNQSVEIAAANKISFFKEGSIADFSIRKIIDTRVEIKVNRLDVKKLYQISYDKKKVEVIPHQVLDEPEFQYDKNDLGLTYSKEASVFKVFAPSAITLVLHIFDSLDSSESRSFEMLEGEKGVWEVKVPEDLKGTFYSFTVSGVLSMFDSNRHIVDPYAKCVVGKTRRAMVVDLAEYPENRPLKERFPIESSVIYEIHVRDMTIDKSSGCDNPGLFLGLTHNDSYLNGDKSTGITTSVSHLKELGVNTIQIMPLQDFDNDESDRAAHNWGYMPIHFETPDGTYGTNWKNDSKIGELKQMVNFLHDQGFKVILDVVYNHTAEDTRLHEFTSEGIFNFNGFTPFYYYRFGNGYTSNGSGCGNELRTEGYMVKKFLLDSLRFWTDYYDFDGFRFDLMGLIDVKTMNMVVEELKKVKNDIFVYGEPWTGGLTPIQPTYKGMQKNSGFAVFNDDFRDAIKGAVSDKKGRGYVQTLGAHHYDKIIQGILGSINTFAASPLETLNYVEVHDNHTLFDKLFFSISHEDSFRHPSGELLEEIERMHRLSGFMLFTSQGIPVLHLGQDFLRTKGGVENSYDAGDDVNKIDWNRKKEFYQTFLYYKNLIDLRKKHPILSVNSEDEVRKVIEFKDSIFSEEYGDGISYLLENCREKLLILVNPYKEDVSLEIEEKWKILLINGEYYQENQPEVKDTLTIPFLSGCILMQTL